MTPGPDRQSGFTLIEVLVAIAVLAVLSVALVDTERTALDAAQRTRTRAFALSQAASLLAEREAGARGDGSGTLPDGSRFAIASRPRGDLVRPGAAIQPVELIVDVKPPRGASARLTTFAWTDTTAR